MQDESDDMAEERLTILHLERDESALDRPQLGGTIGTGG